MAHPAKELLKKVSSVSAAAAALLSAGSASGLPSADPDTAKRTRDALDALSRGGSPGVDQVRFQMGGQADPHTQEILLAGHTSHSSHSSHSSGSYIRGSGSSDSSSGSTYTPYTEPASTPAATPTETPTPTLRPGPPVRLSYKNGTRLLGTVIQKEAWGLQLQLKDTSRVQIARRKLRDEDITALGLPIPTTTAADVPPMVYLRLNDGQTYTGRVAAADGEKITLVGDDSTSRTFNRAQMDPDTFLVMQGLAPDNTPRSASAPPPAVAPVAAAASGPSAQAATRPQILIKLKNGTKMLVTLLSKSATEITVRTTDGHEYRVPASRLSAETLSALQMEAPAPEASPASTPKHKAKA